MEIQERVGRNVRKARLAAGLSQMELVARLELQSEDHGVDQAYISLLESGKKNPTLLTLWRIARALAVPVSQLVDEGESPNRE